jgi:Fe-S-cluster containining protein
VLVSINDARKEPRILSEALELPEWQRTEEWHYRLQPLPFLEGCCFLQKDNLCGVYNTRPDPCRRFRAGSAECAEARSRVGLDPLSYVDGEETLVLTIPLKDGSP